MPDSPYDINLQNSSLDHKIVIGLEKIHELVKVLFIEKSNQLKLSPVQIQLLFFVKHHAQSLCTTSYLAAEFQLTKATISDSIKRLIEKNLLHKTPSPSDTRSFSVQLTQQGIATLAQLEKAANPLLHGIKALSKTEKAALWNSLFQLLSQFAALGILNLQRSCISCGHYEKSGKTSFCHFLQQNLQPKELRLDCPEHLTA